MRMEQGWELDRLSLGAQFIERVAWSQMIPERVKNFVYKLFPSWSFECDNWYSNETLRRREEEEL